MSGGAAFTAGGHSTLICSVPFSYDGQRLTSASYDKTVKICDAASGKSLQSAVVGKGLDNICFDSTDQSLPTEISAIILNVLSGSSTVLNTFANQIARRQGYDLSSDGVWITYNSENLLWM